MSPSDDASDFFVVGIGASAGGLEAVSALLRRTAIDGAAFVVVQHLAPNQSSMLAELLGRASVLKVLTVEDGMVVAPNCVYVTPPNAELGLHNGVLQVMSPASAARRRLPIDAFFRSLAEDRGARAMGVVLSGTGMDGTEGLAAIKSAGGITFVQDPATAKFDGMPRSALDSGNADFCLSAEAIADEIVRVAHHPCLSGAAALPHSHEQFAKLVALLKSSSGIDLTHYKPGTIERRIQRRMALHKFEQLSEYVRFCQTDENELDTLQRDLLINVTTFFRDREPFEALAKSVLPRILAAKRDHDPIRVWVPGCASGEEAYSIAICLLEALEESDRAPRVQIFGTDLDPEAIQHARRGLYSANIATDVSAERLTKFFVRTDEGQYQVSRRVRDLVVFSVQNISRDPPFSKLDLASCRNLLIYLQPAIQQRVLRVLHYALAPAGFLLLGTSESVGDASELFAVVDRKNKIYEAKHVALNRAVADFGAELPKAAEGLPQPGAARPLLGLGQVADRQILEKHAPPTVVINQNLDVLFYRGKTERYLQQPSGATTTKILRLARPELLGPLKQAVDDVFARGETIRVAARFRTAEGAFLPLTLIVEPLQDPATRSRCALVIFSEPVEPLRAPGTDEPAEPLEATRSLRDELALTKDYLHSAIEELERANEDLKSTNEELQSSNEELQSTNEELETSKEELQSTNEELITLNDELHSRMRELSSANDDLHNVLLGVDRAVVIVGLDLRIRRFTQTAEKLLGLAVSDVGRTASQLNSFLGGFGIEGVIAEAIENVTTIEREVQATDRRWYALRIIPYRTADLSIRGAVVSLANIEISKRWTDLTTAVETYADESLTKIEHPLVIIKEDLTVVWVNARFYEAFQLSHDEVVGTRLDKIGKGEWGDAELRRALASMFATGAPFRDRAVAFGASHLRVGASRVRHVANDTALGLLAIEGK